MSESGRVWRSIAAAVLVSFAVNSKLDLEFWALFDLIIGIFCALRALCPEDPVRS